MARSGFLTHSMKKLLLFSLLPTLATAQSIDRHVAASSGNEYSTSVGSMAYTIGEPLTNTLVGGTATFTQGFHQGTINITSVRQQLPVADISVYPNPTVNAVQVQYGGKSAQWQLHTMDGKLITEGQLAQGTNSIDMMPLAQATYLLTVTDGNRQRNTYRIQKIQ
jgi:hypothetical protein